MKTRKHAETRGQINVRFLATRKPSYFMRQSNSSAIQPEMTSFGANRGKMGGTRAGRHFNQAEKKTLVWFKQSFKGQFVGYTMAH